MNKLKRREVEKARDIARKKLIKKYELKMRGGVIYKVINKYFITILISFNQYVDRPLEAINAMADIKPYFIDDVFWEVFNTPDLSKQPVGFRANGAFVMDGCMFYDKDIEITSLDEVEGAADLLLKDVCDKAEKIVKELGDDPYNYLKFTSEKEKKGEWMGLYDDELTRMLYDITDGKYEEAKKRAEYNIANGEQGRFAAGSKDIYDFVVDYCNERL